MKIYYGRLPIRSIQILNKHINTKGESNMELKKNNTIEVTVNRQHQELVEDDDYFINNIEVNGKEIQSLEELEVDDLPPIAVEDAITAEELAELDNTIYKSEKGSFKLIVTDLDEDMVEEYDEDGDYPV
jgi:hypothetical protein